MNEPVKKTVQTGFYKTVRNSITILLVKTGFYRFQTSSTILNRLNIPTNKYQLVVINYSPVMVSIFFLSKIHLSSPSLISYYAIERRLIKLQFSPLPPLYLPLPLQPQPTSPQQNVQINQVAFEAPHTVQRRGWPKTFRVIFFKIISSNFSFIL